MMMRKYLIVIIFSTFNQSIMNMRLKMMSSMEL